MWNFMITSSENLPSCDTGVSLLVSGFTNMWSGIETLTAVVIFIFLLCYLNII